MESLETKQELVAALYNLGYKRDSDYTVIKYKLPNPRNENWKSLHFYNVQSYNVNLYSSIDYILDDIAEMEMQLFVYKIRDDIKYNNEIMDKILINTIKRELKSFILNTMHKEPKLETAFYYSVWMHMKFNHILNYTKFIYRFFINTDSSKIVIMNMDTDYFIKKSYKFFNKNKSKYDTDQMINAFLNKYKKIKVRSYKYINIG